MKFKIDENLPIEIGDILNNTGFDCHNVYDENLNGKPDNKIMKKCIKECRCLITLDMGFANIKNYPPSKITACIVLKLKTQSKSKIIDLIEKLIPYLKSENLKNRLWIVDEKKIRIRE